MTASLPETLSRGIAEEIGRRPTGFKAVSGGDISHAGRLSFHSGPDLFAKWTVGTAALLEAERDGLFALIDAGTALVVPRPISLIEDRSGRYAVLLMDWLDKIATTTEYWKALARGLAELHVVTGSSYGFRGDNFIGRLPQRNDWRDRWPSFFVEMRLEPQVRRATENGLWRNEWTPMYDRLLKRMGDLLPPDPGPSLVHGDLWSGNAMPTTGGPAVFDPATYFGHAEVDLAMTELFGGFAAEFRAVYESVATLDRGFDERKDIYNLYHLLNHLNHFGGSYAAPVQRILRRFSP